MKQSNSSQLGFQFLKSIWSWVFVVSISLVVMPLGSGMCQATGIGDGRLLERNSSTDRDDPTDFRVAENQPPIPPSNPADAHGDADAKLPSGEEPEREFTLTHLFQLLIAATIIIWGYSLVMSGKHGQGWLVLTAIFSVVAYLAGLTKSVFQEVTSSNEVGDWEDE